MGRKRTRDFDLPPRMYRRGARFYYVTHARRWIPLGTDLAQAKRKWADHECTGCAGTVADLCDRYIADCMKKAAGSTVKQYKSFANTIREEWPIPADLLTTPELARWRDSAAPGWGNGVLSLLRVAYAKGMEWGWVMSNPAKSVGFNEMEVRERYMTDEEFRTIRGRLPEWGRVWMDLSYCTSMRVSEPLELKWDQVGEAIVNKTRKTNVKQSRDVDDDIRDILAEAKNRPVVGLYVVATDKGRPVSTRRLQAAFRLAATGIEDIQPRDVRGKAATDAEALGLDFQAMLGHSEQRQSNDYVKGKRTINAPTLKRLA